MQQPCYCKSDCKLALLPMDFLYIRLYLTTGRNATIQLLRFRKLVGAHSISNTWTIWPNWGTNWLQDDSSLGDLSLQSAKSDDKTFLSFFNTVSRLKNVWGRGRGQSNIWTIWPSCSTPGRENGSSLGGFSIYIYIATSHDQKKKKEKKRKKKKREQIRVLL